VLLQRMHPRSASPKNDLLVGWHRSWGAGTARALTEQKFGVGPVRQGAVDFLSAGAGDEREGVPCPP